MPEEISEKIKEFVLPEKREVTSSELDELYAGFETACKKLGGVSILTASWKLKDLRLMRCVKPSKPVRGGLFRIVAERTETA